jgi:outer membrane protein assembly factor BamA
MAPRELFRARRLIITLLVAAALWPPTVRADKKSFIPIPEIITDPNEGNTIGLLGVVLFLDDKDQIQYMVAPDIRYNRTTGWYPALRFFGYPKPERRYSVVISKSTTKDEDYELEYTDRSFWDGRGFLLSSFVHEKDSTDRFFGFGNDSRQNAIRTPLGRQLGGESNYTGNDTQAQATPGVWILPYANISYRMRIREFSVEHGQVTGIPSIFEAHPGARNRGINGGVFWAHQVALTYDSRDSTDIPTHGALAFAYTEAADRSLGSSTSFVKFGADWRDFIPLRKQANPILALHALANYVSGDRDTPFFELSSLGGHRGLRGFGSDRFVDFNRTMAQAELRTRVYQRHLFGVNFELELAPFLEAGEVFRHVTDSPVDDPHVVYGLGFRGIVRPQIVGFVDIGRGSEGNAIFTGVDYPF